MKTDLEEALKLEGFVVMKVGSLEAVTPQRLVMTTTDECVAEIRSTYVQDSIENVVSYFKTLRGHSTALIWIGEVQLEGQWTAIGPRVKIKFKMWVIR